MLRMLLRSVKMMFVSIFQVHNKSDFYSIIHLIAYFCQVFGQLCFV